MTERIAAKDFAAAMRGRARAKKSAPKARKYGNEKVVVDGITFDSKREARRYRDLSLMQQAGAISDLQLQVRIPLVVGGVEIKTPTGRVRHYVADFTYTDTDGSTIIEDSKGFATKEFKLKRDILAAMGLTVREV